MTNNTPIRMERAGEAYTNIRLRRLQADYDKVIKAFGRHPYISVKAVEGRPPERYMVTYKVKGLVPGSGANPVEHGEFVTEIYLQNSYPREKPICTMQSPVFHPNIVNRGRVCLGDVWGAGETLVDVIIQIGDMLQYRSYNPRSALNLTAAQWAVRNESRFPIGNADLVPPEEPEIVIDIDWGPTVVRNTRPAAGGNDFDIELR